MSFVPTDIEGSNNPVLESIIPVPDHIPPGLTACKLIGASYSQNGPSVSIVASAEFTIVRSKTKLSGQGPLVVYVTEINPVPDPAISISPVVGSRHLQ